MLLSNACEYGLRAMLYLTTVQNGGYVFIRDISTELDISFPFLTKVFRRLAGAGLVVTAKGKAGGVMLARPRQEITLFDVVVAIDGPGLFTSCVLGLPGCGQATPCPLHPFWAVERERIEVLFRRMTLAEMVDQMKKGTFRLKGEPIMPQVVSFNSEGLQSNFGRGS